MTLEYYINSGLKLEEIHKSLKSIMEYNQTYFLTTKELYQRTHL